MRDVMRGNTKGENKENRIYCGHDTYISEEYIEKVWNYVLNFTLENSYFPTTRYIYNNYDGCKDLLKITTALQELNKRGKLKKINGDGVTKGRNCYVLNGYKLVKI